MKTTLLKFILCLSAAVLAMASAGAQTRLKVSGAVSDSNGPVIGAAVMEKGSSNGITTDANGRYELTVPSNATLVVSCIGYTTQEVAVGGRAVINFALAEDTEMLEETVVVGFGTQKKVNLSGSISTVNVNKLTESRPVVSIGNALVGMAAGVNVTSGSNAPGNDNATIMVRGRGTLNTATPLIIIDGVEAAINSVNPQDVESMTVLKDAASSAIYGSRAANGVILITTKKGKAGHVKVDYNGYVSLENIRVPSVLRPVSNYADYMEYLNEGYANAGMAAQFSQEKINEWRNGTDPLMYPNSDFITDNFSTGVAQNHVLSVSAGSDRMRLYGSLGYLNNPGVLPNSGQTKYSARVNFEVDPTKWLTVGSNINGYVSDLDMGANPSFEYVASSSPGMTYRFPDGRFGGIENPEDDPQSSANNLQRSRYTTKGTDITNNISSRFFGTIRPFNGFSITGSYTYQFNDKQRNTSPNFIDLWSYRTNSIVTSGTGKTSATNANTKVIRKYGDLVARYENNFFDERFGFSLMAGASTEAYRSANFSATRYDLVSETLTAISAGTGDMSASGSSSEWAMNSYFGRINLSWDNKYLLEGNFRADGSSRFLEGRRWGYFPSASAAWRISEEGFMKDSIFDELKLRVSYGGLGNNSVGNYEAQAMYVTQNYSLGDAVAVGMAQTALANANLTWETTYVSNIGVDFGILRNRLTGTVDLFNKDTKNILISLPAPAVHGTASIPTQNAAEVQNRGIEISLGWQDHKGDFSYSINGNFTYVKNKVLKFKGEDYSLSGANYIKEGLPINSQYLYRFDRIIQTEADMKIVEDMLAANPAAFNTTGKPGYGDMLYKDINGDGIVNNDDKEIVSDGPNPKFYYGLNIALAWKGFDFSTLINGVGGVSQYWQDGYKNTSNVCFGCSINKYVAEHAWRQGRTDATYPKLNYKDNKNTQYSDFYLQNMAYLKIRNVQLGYTIPQGITQKIGIDRVRFYGSLENYFTFTKFRGFDPEVSGFNYPTMKQALFGVNITFGGK